MATRYWVGGSGTWNASSTTNWSTSSGGASGASAPTSTDDVVFDVNSNVTTGAFTVTVSVAVCQDFTASGLDGAMTLAMGTSTLSVYGSWSNPATNFAFSGTGTITFAATTTGKTITTNGISWPSAIVFNGVGGEWTQGGAWTSTSGSGITITNGSFSTGNYALTADSIISANTNTRTVSLGSSSISLTNSGNILNITETNLTFNAGTSTITGNQAVCYIVANNLTFYNVTFTSTSVYPTTNKKFVGINNTFNNLTFPTPTTSGALYVYFGGNATINGTLTLNTSTTITRRMVVRPGVYNGTAVTEYNPTTVPTITVATLATARNVDFQNITAAGASSPWSGTNFGDAGNNTNITFGAAKTVYWNLAAGGNWSSTAWATSSGGAVAAANFPLAHDTAIIEDTGLTAGNTIDYSEGYLIGNLNCGTRTTAFTLSCGKASFCGDVTLSSAMTLTFSSDVNFVKPSGTQTLNTNGITINIDFCYFCSNGGTLSLGSNVTITGGAFYLFGGTLSLGTYTLTMQTFTADNSYMTDGGFAQPSRGINFGTGKITSATTSGTIFTLTTSTTGLTISGTTSVELTGAGSFTRTLIVPALGEASAISVSVTAGTGTIAFSTTSGAYKNITLTGFSGTVSLSNSINCYGNFAIGSATAFSGAGSLSFLATSGTQTINLNNKSFPNNITFGSASTSATTFSLSAAITVVGTVTFAGGTLKLSAGTTNTVGGFTTSGTTLKYLQSTTAGTKATLSDSSGTINATYLAIRDNTATGGATFNAFLGSGNQDQGNNFGWNFGSGFFIFFM